MKRAIRMTALVIALGVTIAWVGTGRNRGWTKTSIPVRTVDEITELEAIRYEKRFSPGIDFLAAGLGGAGALAAASCLFGRKPNNNLN